MASLKIPLCVIILILPIFFEPSKSKIYNPQSPYTQSILQSVDNISKALKTLLMLSKTLEGTNEEEISYTSLQENCHKFLSLALYNLNVSIPTQVDNEGHANFRTWLSAALDEVEMCIDSFQADNEHKIIARSLERLKHLIITGLIKINDDMVWHGESSSPTSHDREPIWLSPDQREVVYGENKMGKPNVVVAMDGSGTCRTITEAVRLAPSKSNKRFVIYVKKGIYKENVVIGREKWNVLMYGDGMDNTIATGNLHQHSGLSLAQTATFAVYGKGFVAKNMQFQNTAGHSNGQALALLSASDQSVFYRCRMDGHQDTLCTQSYRQFYRECDILGTVDFIFGNAAVVIQNSYIRVKRPSPVGKGGVTTITAQGKENPQTRSGISIQNCTITAAENLSGIRTYLGRPWKSYATAAVMESDLGGIIDPKGWYPWTGYGTPLDTILYVEYNNRGPSANIAKRVKRKGLKVGDSTRKYAAKFTVEAFINGNRWIGSTGVPFDGGLH